MSLAYPTLAASRIMIRALIALNLLMGLLILALLIASLVAEGPVMSALGMPPGNRRLMVGGRLVMLIGIAAVPLGHIVLTRLKAIVDTVREGDPFVTDNSLRLQKIAWAVLGMEALHLAVGAVELGAPLDLDWSFSPTRWLAVLLLFVLARVFEHGAHMREELEGTV